MIGADGVVYNMNRMMRVTISAGNASEVIEYCPQADTRLNARMEAVVKYLPTVGTASTRTGFVGKIVIYNPPKTVVGLVQKPVWSIDNYYANNQKAYYNSLGFLRIEAGYWNENSKVNTKEERLNSGRSGYKTLIDGYINTSSYYRRGTDNILEIYCFDKSSKANDDFQKQVAATKATAPGYQDKTVQQDKYTKEIAADTKWYTAIRNIINEFSTEKSPKTRDKIANVVQSEELQMSLATTIRTAADKANGGQDFETIYIHPPQGDPEDGYKIDKELKAQAENLAVGKRFVINAGNIYTALEEIERTYPDGLRIHVNYPHPEPDGKTKYYIWQPGKGEGGQDWSPVEEGGVVEIYNFQNMLETPSIDGAGNFTMKMLFNPKITKSAFIRLRWDESLRFENMISGYTKGVASTANLANFHPSLEGGLYNSQTRSIANSNGDIFNAKFRAGYITHTLSTHSNTWQTEVKTTGVAKL